MNFLSENSVLKHKDYLRQLKLRYSVLEKSFPNLTACPLKEFAAKKLPYEIKSEAIKKRCEIELHELYFESFADKFYPSAVVKDMFGSEANFLYQIEAELMENYSSGFLLVFVNSRNKLSFQFGNELSDVFLKHTPLLAVDLWEHAYFDDYGFDRKRYLKSALSCLNFGKINDFYKIY